MSPAPQAPPRATVTCYSFKVRSGSVLITPLDASVAIQSPPVDLIKMVIPPPSTAGRGCRGAWPLSTPQGGGGGSGRVLTEAADPANRGPATRRRCHPPIQPTACKGEGGGSRKQAPPPRGGAWQAQVHSRCHPPIQPTACRGEGGGGSRKQAPPPPPWGCLAGTGAQPVSSPHPTHRMQRGGGGGGQ